MDLNRIIRINGEAVGNLFHKITLRLERKAYADPKKNKYDKHGHLILNIYPKDVEALHRKLKLSRKYWESRGNPTYSNVVTLLEEKGTIDGYVNWGSMDQVVFKYMKLNPPKSKKAK